MNKIKAFIDDKISSFNSSVSSIQDDYRLAKEVFKRITETTEEGKQKNLFGRYKSPLVKEWQLLLRIYESDYLYLAEFGKCIQ